MQLQNDTGFTHEVHYTANELSSKQKILVYGQDIFLFLKPLTCSDHQAKEYKKTKYK